MTDYTKQIERYFRKEMSEEEARVFLERIEQDPELKKEFEAREMINDAVEMDIEKDLRKKVMHWKNEKKQKRVPIKRILGIAVAASIVGVVLFVLFLPNEVNHNKLAEEYYHYETIRGDASSKQVLQAAQQVIVASSSELYDEAISELQKIDQDEKEYGESRYLLGHLYYQNGEFERAVSSFKKAAAQSQVYEVDAQWYSALAYLKAGQPEKAAWNLKAIVADEENRYVKKAEELLKKVE